MLAVLDQVEAILCFSLYLFFTIMRYNKIYKKNNVWGKEPNKLLQNVCNYYNKKKLEFLDLGCGQGRDSLFMLQKGFKVTAVDSSREGIKKIKESIQANNLSISDINLLCEDIKTFKIEKNKYTIINAFNSLQFLLKKNALWLIERIKKAVKSKGYIIISGFTTKGSPYKTTTIDSRCFFEPQELKKIFSDFKIIFYDEKVILDKGHPGKPEPHKHNIVEMIAQKNKKIRPFKE